MKKSPLYDYYVLYTILGCLCVCIFVILVIVCLKPKNKHKKQPKWFIFTQNVPIWFAGTLILLILFRSILHLGPYLIDTMPYLCKILNASSTVLYPLTKMWIYIALTARLHIMFAKTEYSYNFYGFILPLYCVSIFFGIFSSTVYIILDESYFDFIGEFCETTLPVWGYISAMLWDALISLVLLYAYVHKLIKMKMVIAHDNDAKNTELINKMLIRYVVCVAFAVITSFISMVAFIITTLSIVILMDTIINLISLLLLRDNMEKIYLKLCGICDKCCNKITKSDEHVKQLKVLKLKDTSNTTTSPMNSSQLTNLSVTTPVSSPNMANYKFSMDKEIVFHYEPEGGNTEHELKTVETPRTFMTDDDEEKNAQIQTDAVIAKELAHHLVDIHQITSGNDDELQIKNDAMIVKIINNDGILKKQSTMGFSDDDNSHSETIQ